MGIRTGTSIRLIKKGNASTGPVAAPSLGEAPSTPLERLARRLPKLMKDEFDVERPQSINYFALGTRDEFLTYALRPLLEKELYAKLFPGETLEVKLGPGRIYKYDSSNTLGFQSWIAGRKDETMLSGSATITKGLYSRGYSYTIRLSQLRVVDEEEQAELKRIAKLPKVKDPAKLLTPQEAQKLKDFDATMAKGEKLEFPSVYGTPLLFHYHSIPALQNYLEAEIFDSPNSQGMLKITLAGYGLDEDNLQQQWGYGGDKVKRVWLDFYRLHQKKQSSRRVCIEVLDNPQGQKAYHIVSSRKL